MSRAFEFLDDSFPDIVDVWRYDQDARVADGIKTARTILAERMGISASFGFFDDDVWLHCQSTFQGRLDKPSRTGAGRGSPFISGILKPNETVGKWIRQHPDSARSLLYKLAVPRDRIIVPRFDYYDTRINGRQEDALEVLVIGDIDKNDIQVTTSIE